ncbi:hypothetical protein AYI70_g4847 [Smittium culicis]|uniref:Uncharacterized protein n=1 Tax=Smittium culicis TaxID=133412 RepID=A0A1R1XX54_9FUNG|nr:hypothetical protein AYI70_g4847 [Smittium culicis]
MNGDKSDLDGRIPNAPLLESDISSCSKDTKAALNDGSDNSSMEIGGLFSNNERIFNTWASNNVVYLRVSMYEKRIIFAEQE